MECLRCQQQTNNPKFCSLSCSASYNNSKAPKRKRQERKCANCDKQFIFHPSEASTAKCCSNQCRLEYAWTQKYDKVMQDRGWKPNVTNNTIRNWFIKFYGNNCMLCGVDADNWQGKPITLIVDHINGDCQNQSLDNVRIVCPNCDSQLDTYKAKNKGRSTRGYHIVQHNK